MDDPKWKPPSWLDWAVIVAIVAVVVIAALALVGPQPKCIFCAVSHTLATSTPLVTPTPIP